MNESSCRVAVQNGMVMVSYINKLRDGGMSLDDAVITGASVRLRAELLSALIGSISLIPFIFMKREAGQSKPFSLRNLDMRSAISRLFRSDIGKWVFPWIPISGRCTRVTLPPRRFTASRHFLAISRKMRH